MPTGVASVLTKHLVAKDATAQVSSASPPMVLFDLLKTTTVRPTAITPSTAPDMYRTNDVCTIHFKSHSHLHKKTGNGTEILCVKKIAQKLNTCTPLFFLSNPTRCDDRPAIPELVLEFSHPAQHTAAVLLPDLGVLNH